MTRFLALFFLAAATPVAAEAARRNFSVTSFDRIRMEAPFDVTLVTNKAPFARADGPVTSLDAVDLRIEGRTLIVRQRSGSNFTGKGGAMRLSLGRRARWPPKARSSSTPRPSQPTNSSSRPQEAPKCARQPGAPLPSPPAAALRWHCKAR
jgi:hypothetical protein